MSKTLLIVDFLDPSNNTHYYTLAYPEVYGDKDMWIQHDIVFNHCDKIGAVSGVDDWGRFVFLLALHGYDYLIVLNDNVSLELAGCILIKYER